MAEFFTVEKLGELEKYINNCNYTDAIIKNNDNSYIIIRSYNKRNGEAGNYEDIYVIDEDNKIKLLYKNLKKINGVYSETENKDNFFIIDTTTKACKRVNFDGEYISSIKELIMSYKNNEDKYIFFLKTGEKINFSVYRNQIDKTPRCVGTSIHHNIINNYSNRVTIYQDRYIRLLYNLFDMKTGNLLYTGEPGDTWSEEN